MDLSEKKKYCWIKIDVKGNIPEERLYHSSCVCPEGKYSNKLIIFGGRNSQNKPLNDLWALTLKNTENTMGQNKAEISFEQIKSPAFAGFLLFFLPLCKSYVFCLRSAVACHDFECDGLSFVQSFKTFTLNSRIVYEYVFSFLVCDKAVSFLCVEPLYSSFVHLCYLR